MQGNARLSSSYPQRSHVASARHIPDRAVDGEAPAAAVTGSCICCGVVNCPPAVKGSPPIARLHALALPAVPAMAPELAA